MWVPLTSPWPEATVGGIVASNFNAPLRMRYGAVRDLVLALTAVLPDGRVIRAGRPVMKNVAGYDLVKLLVGAYGTLGLITDVTLRLMPQPRMRTTYAVPVDDLARGLAWGQRLLHVALTASSVLLCHGCQVPGLSSAYVLLYTTEGAEEDVGAEVTEVRAALEELDAARPVEAEASGSEVWAAWMQTTPLEETLLRVGLAPKDLPQFLSPELVPALNGGAFVADLANGLLYLRGVEDLATIRRAARQRDGYAVVLRTSPVGRNGLDLWEHTPDGLDLMRALKSAWDTQGLFNPDVFIV
jgi:D-lactate dehydrogenase (cytochrome)